jgi:hypothetical protein
MPGFDRGLPGGSRDFPLKQSDIFKLGIAPEVS